MPPSFRSSRRNVLGVICGITAITSLPPAMAESYRPGKTNLPRIGIIGSGQVGGTLGRLWAKAGYQVMFSSREPELLQDVVANAGANARAGDVAQAIAFGDVILLAVPYGAEPSIAEKYSKALAGKILIDADNAYPYRDGAVAEKARSFGVAKYSAQLFPGTLFVRAFNSVNASSLTNGGGGDTEVLYSFTNNKAGEVAAQLIKATGCVPVRGHDL